MHLRGQQFTVRWQAFDGANRRESGPILARGVWACLPAHTIGFCASFGLSPLWPACLLFVSDRPAPHRHSIPSTRISIFYHLRNDATQRPNTCLPQRFLPMTLRPVRLSLASSGSALPPPKMNRRRNSTSVTSMKKANSSLRITLLHFRITAQRLCCIMP